MRIKCNICGFENDMKYGNYCVRCRGMLINCMGNCAECINKINKNYKIDKNKRRCIRDDTSTA